MINRKSSYNVILMDIDDNEKESIPIPLYIQSKEKNSNGTNDIYESYQFIHLYHINECISQLLSTSSI